jgi:type III pantothenate kinase
MLLAIDVGNTNISFGVFQGEQLLATFRMTTKMPRTSDEYGMMITTLLEKNQICASDVKDAIVASVVPKVMHALYSSLIKYLNVTPIVVEPGIKTGIRLQCENPKAVGADRIVDVVAGYELYGGPVIVIDFGTATTYDLVTKDGVFGSDVIAPGIQTSAQALWAEAAKLPEIEIRKPESILGHDTITSMQAGIVYGQIGQTEYIVKHMKKESGLKDIKVVATGGLGKIIASETDVIDIYDPDLLMHGLRVIFDKQKKDVK